VKSEIIVMRQMPRARKREREREREMVAPRFCLKGHCMKNVRKVSDIAHATCEKIGGGENNRIERLVFRVRERNSWHMQLFV
jgi:hypothetical protein